MNTFTIVICVNSVRFSFEMKFFISLITAFLLTSDIQATSAVIVVLFGSDQSGQFNSNQCFLSRFPLLTLSGLAFSVVCQARGGGGVSEARIPKIKVNIN